MDMRIAEVCAVYPPYRGGLGAVCADNAAMLTRSGHDVTVIVPWYRRERVGVLEHEEKDGIRIHRFAPFLEYGNAAWMRGLGKMLEGFDVVHFHYPFIGALDEVLAWKKKTGGKLLVTYHMDLVSGDGVRKYFFPRYVKGALPRLVDAANAIAATSLDYIHHSQITPFLSSRKNIVTIPNAVDTDWYSPSDVGVDDVRMRYGISDDESIVLFVGGMDAAHAFKGVSVLIEAFAMLPAALRDGTRLVLVGKGDLQQEYTRQVEKSGIMDRVVFPGGVSEEEKRAWYRACVMNVLPSTERSEAFGIVLAEAMACGKAVVTTALPGPRSVVDDGVSGLLVPARDVGALSNALARLLSDVSLARSMGARGREKVCEAYSVDVVGWALSEVITRL